MERPLQVGRKAREEGKDELDLGRSEVCQSLDWKGKEAKLGSPGEHPRTVGDSHTTVLFF